MRTKRLVEMLVRKVERLEGELKRFMEVEREEGRRRERELLDRVMSVDYTRYAHGRALMEDQSDVGGVIPDLDADELMAGEIVDWEGENEAEPEK